MKCPKCKTVNPASAKECNFCGVVFAHIRTNQPPPIDVTCPWNDHGYLCGQRGIFSDATNGAGPWYCREHWAKLKGWPLIDCSKSTSYRDRWYAERGLDYKKPKLGNMLPFYCIGIAAKEVERQREPGDDDEDIPEPTEVAA